MVDVPIAQNGHHRYIPRVLDYFQEYGRHYIVMDYIEGTNLHEELVQKGTLGFEQERVLAWADELCEVLEYLHTQQEPIIFRDLKPANIMLLPNDQITGYAPPEQFGQGQTEVRSDVYSLAATLHHLLTGRDPSTAPFIFPPVESLNRALSPELGLVLTKALNLDPNNRYQSVREMREALQNVKAAFNVTVDFVHPYLYMQEAPLAQFM